jgi:TolA-binding protein
MVLRQPANVEATRLDVEAIRREQTELAAQVLELRTRLESQSEMISALRADNNLELRQLTERLDVLVARLEELGARSDRTRRETPSLPSPAAADSAASVAAVGPGGGVGKNAQASFDAAKRDFSRGNYQLAVAGSTGRGLRPRWARR